MYGAGKNMNDFIEGMRQKYSVVKTGNKENHRKKFEQHIICNYRSAKINELTCLGSAVTDPGNASK
jgi:hypothetical protein